MKEMHKEIWLGLRYVLVPGPPRAMANVSNIPQDYRVSLAAKRECHNRQGYWVTYALAPTGSRHKTQPKNSWSVPSSTCVVTH